MSYFAILVNTTDNFDDCWVPFFTLFRKYWPEYSGKIYLNTENKNFHFEGLNIISIRNSRGDSSKKTWTSCLRSALDFIEEDVILYLQEDYFLRDGVIHSEAIKFLDILKQNSEISSIYLTDQATSGPFKDTSIEGLKKVDSYSNSYLSLQAAFWKKDHLRRILFPPEDGWLFEHYGTKRARLKKYKLQIFNVDPNIYRQNETEIIPYIFTGILKGKWNREVESLFKNNDLKVDLSIRGYFDPDPKISNSFTFKSILLRMKALRSELNLIKRIICKN